MVAGPDGILASNDIRPGIWIFSGIGRLSRIVSVVKMKTKLKWIQTENCKPVYVPWDSYVKVMTVERVRKYADVEDSDEEVVLDYTENIGWVWTSVINVKDDDWIAIPRYDTNWVWSRKIDLAAVKIFTTEKTSKYSSTKYIWNVTDDWLERVARRRQAGSNEYVTMRTDKLKRWLFYTPELFRLLGVLWAYAKVDKLGAMWLAVDDPDMVKFIVDASVDVFGVEPTVQWTSASATAWGAAADVPNFVTNVLLWRNDGLAEVLEWLFAGVTGDRGYSTIWKELWSTRVEFVEEFIVGTRGVNDFIDIDDDKFQQIFTLARTYGIPLNTDGTMNKNVIKSTLGSDQETFIKVVSTGWAADREIDIIKTSNGSVAWEGIVVAHGKYN